MRYLIIRLRWSVCIALCLCTVFSHAKDSTAKLLALPPAPKAVTTGLVDLFATTPDALKNNHVGIFYATPRLPADDATAYSKNFDDRLRVGLASLTIGSENLDWETLHSQAASAERDKPLYIHLDQVKQIAELAADDPLAKLAPDMQAYVDQVNAALEKNNFKDITIIAHGAFNSFYYAIAEAAQYRFFTGKQAVTVAYSWPAVENHLAYKANAKHAEQSEAGLVRLVKILGTHSNAENINILGYSVGGRLAGGAMAKLADEHEGEDLTQLNKSLRLGHLYLTSSDEPIEEFRSYAPKFVQMFDLITVTVAPDDPILHEAEMTGGGTRLGRPTDPSKQQKAKNAPTEAERQGIRDAVSKDQLHILDLEISDIPGYQFYHGSWYLNPWVSSDVLVGMNMKIHPSQRGLASKQEQGLAYWYFPKDYASRLRQELLLQKNKRERHEAQTATEPAQ